MLQQQKGQRMTQRWEKATKKKQLKQNEVHSAEVEQNIKKTKQKQEILQILSQT